ncbi:response regulator [Pantoea sp. NPDC088449]|uniref:DNA-binding response regulator, NarL/FixJ family, contains REC and HTH domains n=1 Tax=Candidatus Pantoea floridensis TaxID=1938870 RepID=A0A286BQ87_9GAMM|nr:response regulator transcription factor [Pantoea floridensis]PIF22957.1 DNA-binding NarL/FixJ family response regulator [Enterobacteriaceae bacterium JKS000233]SOD36288.1 DNA-binding response regulator, NarL/FixJ family, contains REC and HTH domains [Pantoea floridensis]
MSTDYQGYRYHLNALQKLMCVKPMKYSIIPTKISVILLDDHPMIRYSFEYMACQHPDIVVLGCFSSSSELMNSLLVEKPDVLVLDYILNEGELDGLSLIRKILAHYPDMRILMASSVETLALIRAAFQLGVRGYINKREESANFFEAIRTLAANKLYIPTDLDVELSQLSGCKRRAAGLTNDDKPSLPMRERLNLLLTPREAEVIYCFLNGMTVLEIAKKLKRSRKTISGHKQAGMKKLGINSDPELFKIHDELFK